MLTPAPRNRPAAAPFALILAALAALCTACGGQRSDPGSGDFAGLDLRPGAGPTDPTDPETGLATRKFALSLDAAATLLPGGSAESERGRPRPDDPFTRRQPASLESVQKALEEAGVDFPDGTGLAYDPGARVLSATHAVEVLDAIEGLLGGSAADPMGLMTFRFEFYDVPALLALRLEQSASSQWDHTPEWEAVQKFLSKGEARTAGVVTLHSVSRQRPRFEDGEVFFVTTGYLRDPSDPSAEPLPLLEERFSGTRIEIDAVLREDEHTMDIALSLELATAAAEAGDGEVSRGRRGEVAEASRGETPVPSRKLSTQITLRNGETRLLGSWSAAGAGGADGSGTRKLVFLTAHVQRPALTVP